MKFRTIINFVVAVLILGLPCWSAPDAVASTMAAVSMNLTSDSSSPNAGDGPCTGKDTKYQYCGAGSSEEATRQYQKVRNDLLGNELNRQCLANIEKVIKRSLRDCMLAQHSEDTNSAADLLRLLAANWERLRDFRRANELYETAYNSTGGDAAAVLEKIAILQGWAHCNVLARNKGKAENLAAQQTTIARLAVRRHEFGLSLLIASLQFEADIYKKTDNDAAMRDALREEKLLTSREKKCNGVCDFHRVE